jgi:hypothetical protein
MSQGKRFSGDPERAAEANRKAAECRELAAKESKPGPRARLDELAAQYEQDARRWSGEDRSPFTGRGGLQWLRKYRKRRGMLDKA